ncbi:RidA family protein [Hasllibacter sp. MH4015]|uniref:RidA family protein n=1 Tax=Hasllibacter sp. MH4015 TaxID=2854029 RepID=UPI001CD41FB7|nr:RidA family protein [Hasllibacter sp. MH4015]
MPSRKVIIPEGMENIYDTYHYAPGILVGDTLYCSGQVGRDENLNVVEGAEAQFTQAFENAGKVLAAAGASFDDVVELESWFAGSMDELKTFMAVKDRYFTNRYPTWTGFSVKGFSMPGILVEIKCKAILGLSDA